MLKTRLAGFGMGRLAFLSLTLASTIVHNSDLAISSSIVVGPEGQLSSNHLKQQVAARVVASPICDAATAAHPEAVSLEFATIRIDFFRECIGGDWPIRISSTSSSGILRATFRSGPSVLTVMNLESAGCMASLAAQPT